MHGVTVALVLLVLFSMLGAGLRAEAQMPSPPNVLQMLREILNVLGYIKNRVDELYWLYKSFSARVYERLAAITSKLSALQDAVLGLDRKVDRLQRDLNHLKEAIGKLQPISVEQAEKILRLLEEAKATAESLAYMKWLPYLVIANFILNLLTLLIVLAK